MQVLTFAVRNSSDKSDPRAFDYLKLTRSYLSRHKNQSEREHLLRFSDEEEFDKLIEIDRGSFFQTISSGSSTEATKKPCMPTPKAPSNEIPSKFRKPVETKKKKPRGPPLMLYQDFKTPHTLPLLNEDQLEFVNQSRPTEQAQTKRFIDDKSSTGCKQDSNTSLQTEIKTFYPVASQKTNERKSLTLKYEASSDDELV